MFHDYGEEPRITAIEDETTIDPLLTQRGAMHVPEVFKDGVPEDMHGNPLFPKYEYYLNPVDYKIDNRPHFSPYNS